MHPADATPYVGDGRDAESALGMPDAGTLAYLEDMQKLVLRDGDDGEPSCAEEEAEVKAGAPRAAADGRSRRQSRERRVGAGAAGCRSSTRTRPRASRAAAARRGEDAGPAALTPSASGWWGSCRGADALNTVELGAPQPLVQSTTAGGGVLLTDLRTEHTTQLVTKGERHCGTNLLTVLKLTFGAAACPRSGRFVDSGRTCAACTQISTPSRGCRRTAWRTAVGSTVAPMRGAFTRRRTPSRTSFVVRSPYPWLLGMHAESYERRARTRRRSCGASA